MTAELGGTMKPILRFVVHLSPVSYRGREYYKVFAIALDAGISLCVSAHRTVAAAARAARRGKSHRS